MNCELFGESIYAYLGGQLEPEPRAAFERHRAGCESCGERFQQHAKFCCREFVGFLDRFLEEDLSGSEHEVFDVHLQLCPPCLEYLESYRVTVELARRGRGGKAGPDCSEMPSELVRAILAALGGRPE